MQMKQRHITFFIYPALDPLFLLIQYTVKNRKELLQ